MSTNPKPGRTGPAILFSASTIVAAFDAGLNAINHPWVALAFIAVSLLAYTVAFLMREGKL
jgi:hypothetical protein